MVWNSGALMDDATILFCGHSFGSESLQRVIENVSKILHEYHSSNILKSGDMLHHEEAYIYKLNLD